MKDKTEEKGYYFTRDRFVFIAGILIFIFLVFMVVIVWQGENIKRDPCGVCAKRTSSEITCSFSEGTGKIFGRTYYENFTIIDWIGER